MSLLSFIKETQTEMKHVVWPKMSTAFSYTVILIVLCIIVAALLGFFDYVFGLGVQKILVR